MARTHPCLLPHVAAGLFIIAACSTSSMGYAASTCPEGTDSCILAVDVEHRLIADRNVDVNVSAFHNEHIFEVMPTDDLGRQALCPIASRSTAGIAVAVAANQATMTSVADLAMQQTLVLLSGSSVTVQIVDAGRLFDEYEGIAYCPDDTVRAYRRRTLASALGMDAAAPRAEIRKRFSRLATDAQLMPALTTNSQERAENAVERLQGLIPDEAKSWMADAAAASNGDADKQQQALQKVKDLLAGAYQRFLDGNGGDGADPEDEPTTDEPVDDSSDDFFHGGDSGADAASAQIRRQDFVAKQGGLTTGQGDDSSQGDFPSSGDSDSDDAKGGDDSANGFEAPTSPNAGGVPIPPALVEWAHEHNFNASDLQGGMPSFDLPSVGPDDVRAWLHEHNVTLPANADPEEVAAAVNKTLQQDPQDMPTVSPEEVSAWLQAHNITTDANGEWDSQIPGLGHAGELSNKVAAAAKRQSSVLQVFGIVERIVALDRTMSQYGSCVRSSGPAAPLHCSTTAAVAETATSAPIPPPVTTQPPSSGDASTDVVKTETPDETVTPRHHTRHTRAPHHTRAHTSATKHTQPATPATTADPSDVGAPRNTEAVQPGAAVHEEEHGGAPTGVKTVVVAVACGAVLLAVAAIVIIRRRRSDFGGRRRTNGARAAAHAIAQVSGSDDEAMSAADSLDDEAGNQPIVHAVAAAPPLPIVQASRVDSVAPPAASTRPPTATVTASASPAGPVVGSAGGSADDDEFGDLVEV